MRKLIIGLKSYRYFDQAKELADKLGVVLNESVLNESSSMALSIYSPTNLADLLTDEVEQTRDEKSRYGVAKNGTPYYVYYDLDAHGYRTATTSWKVRH